MYFLTADEHYGHNNILRYCKRPFSSVSAMNRHIIEQHNEVVKDDDIVYHLGDFTMKGKHDYAFLESIMNKLSGIHHLIIGSHDMFSPGAYLQVGFDSVHTSLHWHVDDFSVFLAHDPALFQFAEESIMFCGHIHNHWKKNPTDNIINVGVDVWDFRPVSMEEIEAIAENDNG